MSRPQLTSREFGELRSGLTGVTSSREESVQPLQQRSSRAPQKSEKISEIARHRGRTQSAASTQHTTAGHTITSIRLLPLSAVGRCCLPRAPPPALRNIQLTSLLPPVETLAQLSLHFHEYERCSRAVPATQIPTDRLGVSHRCARRPEVDHWPDEACAPKRRSSPRETGECAFGGFDC
jgi:hypothetical protein